MRRQSSACRVASLVLLLALLAAPAMVPSDPEPGPEATSLLGQPLYPPEIPPERRARLEENLARARADLEGDPNNPEALIWLGRRTAYLGRYQEALGIYSHGIEQHPENPKLYRHRGHRYLTVRALDKAVADLETAARLTAGRPDEIEPDGLPNPQNLPRSTTQSNIWYHLGLAYYFKADFASAHRAFSACLTLSQNHDLLVATTYWLYLTLRRLGRAADAEKLLEPIRPEMEILENFAYHDLLLLHKGERSAEALLARTDADPLTQATMRAGVGSWYLVNGQIGQARTLFQQVLQGSEWAAFGFIAAEAELARGLGP